MKKTVHSIALLFFLLYLINTPQISARFLASQQGEEELKLNDVTTLASLDDREEKDSSNKLMGLEDFHCGDGEDCTKRRMVAEAHLDYIYTQRHEP
ncbi:hypothetical protein Vadar_001048 [Vaccinium darrowii]|uniref:Uncharacterized protein n=1 Tax=Vaccinium darrowii TaxID=229202 RepID=A0ACB7Z9S0_9ERIC|nr:hypothetical protein Vadar_001048 [Vaccinium darrowii]